MSTQVGAIFYDVTLDTSKAVAASRAMQPELERAAASFNVITSAVKIYAAALALVKAAEMADDMRLLAARVNVASDSIQAGAAAMDQLREISTRTRSALADNVQVFTRLNPAIKQMGGQASDTLRVVELLSKAITVSGATAAEKSAAMIQFGQALGSGKLAGDELRSLLENAPYLMKQLAAGLGVPIGALKGLGEQGKLTADVVVNALGKAADSISKDFATFPQTLGSAFVVAGDALRRLNEKIDTFTQKSAMLTGIVNGVGIALNGLANLFDKAGDSADKLGKERELERWSKASATVLSYVADAADITWQTLSVLGRNVAFVFNAVGNEIGGIGAQIAAVLRGDLSGAVAIGSAMKEEAAKNRRELDAADSKTLADRKLWGQQLRAEFEKGAAPAGAQSPASQLTAPADPEQARKDASKRAAAQAYLDGLLADTKTGLEKIGLEERKALEENKRRALEDTKNADIYAKAKSQILVKYARERALLTEQYARETAAVAIAITTDETDRIIAIREEAFRAADADVRLGVKTFQQGEQAKVLAAFQAGQALADVGERNAQARFAGQYAAARDTEQRIRLVQEESIRAAAVAYARGKATFEEFEAAKVKAARQAEDDMRAVRAERSQVRVDTLQLKANSGGIDDQAALIRAQAQQQLAATMEAQDKDKKNAQLYADKMVAIEEDMQRRIADSRSQSLISNLNATASAFDALAAATKDGTGKQDAVYQAAFLTQKAFAIASSIVAIQSGVAQAAALPFPANLGAMASVIAATASIITTIKGTQYGGGRQYGGPVSADTLYRINETGRPEMFTAANGSQYMLPTADGKVTPANRVGQGGNGPGPGGGQPMTVIQNFTIQGAPANLQTQQQIAAMAARGLQMAAARNN